MAKLHSFPRFDTLYFSLWLWNVHPIIRLISSNGRRLCRSKMFGSCVWSFFCDSVELNGDIFLFRYAGYLCTWRIRTKLHNSCVVCVCVCVMITFLFFKCLGLVGYEFTTCLTMASAIIRMLLRLLRLCAHNVPFLFISSLYSEKKFTLNHLALFRFWITSPTRKKMLIFFRVRKVFALCARCATLIAKYSTNLDMGISTEIRIQTFVRKFVGNHAWKCVVAMEQICLTHKFDQKKTRVLHKCSC